MKTRRVWVLALIFIAPLSLQAQAPGLINMAEADPFTVLHIYREASGLELITSSQVNKVTARITIQPPGTVEKSEMLKLIEKALLEQAAIVITKLDDKRASVTYNSELPVKTVTNVKPILRPITPDGKPVSALATLPTAQINSSNAKDIRSKVTESKIKIIDPDNSIYGIPFDTTEDQFIAANGKPSGYLRLNGDETVMIYGRSHAFVFEQGKLAGVRITHSIVDWKLSNGFVDMTPFDDVKWRLANGIKSGMNLKDVKEILGDKLSTERYQRYYLTDKARIEFEFSRNTQAGDDDGAYKLYGIFVRSK